MYTEDGAWMSWWETVLLNYTNFFLDSKEV